MHAAELALTGQSMAAPHGALHGTKLARGSLHHAPTCACQVLAQALASTQLLVGLFPMRLQLAG